MNFKNIEEKIKKWVLKLQALPEGHKKAILWTIVVIIALPMIFFWFQGTIKKFDSIESIDLGLPEMEIIEEVSPTDQSTENLPELQNGSPKEAQNEVDLEIINQQ